MGLEVRGAEVWRGLQDPGQRSRADLVAAVTANCFILLLWRQAAEQTCTLHTRDAPQVNYGNWWGLFLLFSFPEQQFPPPQHPSAPLPEWGKLWKNKTQRLDSWQPGSFPLCSLCQARFTAKTLSQVVLFSFVFFSHQRWQKETFVLPVN